MSDLVSLLIGLFGFAGATFFIVRRVKRSLNPGDVTIKLIITAGCVALWGYMGIQARDGGMGVAFMVPAIAAATGILLAVLWTPYIAGFLSSPLTRLYDGGEEEAELRPLYSIAEALRKKAQHAKAIQEVRRQLDKFPEDFQGWMMIANIQGEDMRDLDAAIATVDHILTFEGLSPRNIAYALGRIADWHLSQRSDRDAAREALERIMQMLPNSVEAQLAAQRIAHMASAEHLADMREPHVIALKRSEEKIGLRGEAYAPPPPEDASVTARRYLDHLAEHPLDNEAREKLAMLYANEFRRLDLATAELEQLIATPNQLPKHVVQWLNLLADFQIRLGAGADIARQTLQRILDLYPKSAAANNANVRMSQLRLELNQLSVQKTLKLGNYEQNIGLRKMNSGGEREI